MKEFVSHLFNRGFDFDIFHDISRSIDWENEVVTFYIYNLSGQIIGFQKYQWDKPKRSKELKPSELKYFSHITNKSIALFGLQYFDKNQKNIYLVEGVWDAITLIARGYNALAVLSNNSNKLKNWLYTMPYDFLPVCDGDSAGLKLRNLSTTGSYVQMPDSLDVNDLNSYSDSELFDTFSKGFKKL